MADGEELPRAVAGRLEAFVTAAERLGPLRTALSEGRAGWTQTYDRYTSTVSTAFGVGGALTGIQDAELGSDARVLMGVPTYEPYGFMHRRGVETPENAIVGVVAGLRGLGAGGTFEGIALYAEWTTDESEWRAYERDVAADYRQAFGAAPPPVNGVVVSTDTDNTGETAEAFYGDVVFRARPTP